MPKYKVLKAVAHNVGHSFLSDMNTMDGFKTFVPQHIYESSVRANVPRVVIDLLRQEVSPSDFVATHLSESMAFYRDFLYEQCVLQGSAEYMVAEATLALEFTMPLNTDPEHLRNRRPSFTCEVVIVDDRGTKHRGRPGNWWSDHMGGVG